MALPPDSTNDAFVREVEENYRRDQIESFAKTYGKWIVAGVLVFLALVGGFLYWQSERRAQRELHTEQLSTAFREISEGKQDAASKRLDEIAASDGDSLRASALLTRAALLLESNDRAGALAAYRQLADDDSMPQAYRDAALVRATTVEFDSLQPQQIVERLTPLAKPGNAWFGSAGELIALAYLRGGQNDRAGRMFAQLAADRSVPGSIRSRAVQIAGSLGVDASASLPALQQDQ